MALRLLLSCCSRDQTHRVTNSVASLSKEKERRYGSFDLEIVCWKIKVPGNGPWDWVTNRWVLMLSALHITYKEEEVLIISGPVRSLSDDPYAEHRIFQHFNPTFILVNFKKDIAIVGRHGDFSLCLTPEVSLGLPHAEIRLPHLASYHHHFIFGGMSPTFPNCTR